MGRRIHPSAIIDRSAELADDVEIGPYVCIEGPAKVGAGCVIQAQSILAGKVVMGDENLIGFGSVIGTLPQDLTFNPATDSGVRIGSGNTFREHCTIHRATRAGGWTNVQVQDDANLGGGSVFHQFIRIGRLAMVQGMSGFGQDIPPFLIAFRVNRVSGVNAVGLRRHGFSPKERAEVKEAFRLVYRSDLNLGRAIEEAENRTWGTFGNEFFAFVKGAKRRGICSLGTTQEY